ncbi:MAG TPA: flavodoxin family protein [Clostridiales bacterium]|nr:flavodoxin family protein [Clostridiales bacterium]
MRIAILSGNPKTDGLNQTMIQAVIAGAAAAGAEVEEIRLQELKLLRCQVCGDGWGTCLQDRRCQFGADGFTDTAECLLQADALVLATPVYWGEMSETLKCFLDRLRRCQRGQDGALAGKQVLLLANPGGGGGGQISCLQEMERFCQHVGLIIFDTIGARRWTLDYQRQAAFAAARALASGRQNGDTVIIEE